MKGGVMIASVTEDYEEGKTVLVVEDDRTHRALMDKILKECEFKTVQAENGIIALAKVDAKQHFDLILMDWDMPELNGLETAKAIRAREIDQGSAHTPIIAFTANQKEGDREQCIAAGMDAYLSKDVWMPKWRSKLINNLQGLIAGSFDLQDFESDTETKNGDGIAAIKIDLEEFDVHTLEQSAALLKDDLGLAVSEYLEDAAFYVRSIREGMESFDAEKVARASHTLKSNSKNFGLTAVSQISEIINNEARGGELYKVEELCAQLQQAFVLAERKLHDFIKNNGY